VASAGAKTNSAQVTAADQFDSDSTPNNGIAAEDDQDSATVSPTAADLSLTKTVNDAAANVGDNVTFTITVSNAGPDGATGVVVTDALPAGLTFVSSTPSQGTYNSGTGVWTVGSVANGGTATLQLVATVANTGAKTNTAEITASDQLDPDSTPNNAAGAEDDQASATVTPPIADLSLTKTVDNASANVGQNVTFTVTVSNTGPDAATNVSVADALPAGLTFVSATPSQGTYNSGTGVWTVGTINSAANATLTITATVASTGTKTNTAQVQAVDQFDPDSTPGNSAAAEDDQASAAVAPPTVDLSLTKTVDDASPAIGQNVTFTTTLTNAGPATATGVVVTDVLPAGLTFVSATPSQGTYDAATGLWTVGSLAPGATVTLQVTATVVTGGPKTNTAQVSAVDQFDVDSTPNNNVPAEDDQDAALVQPPRTLSKRAFLAR
ncbi:MAG: DUF11 domain-containing protein, partial [Planctomycetales bacterium]|nr:DUF11 domain-containing protein [Planctomycetales bacterium]